MTTATPAKPVKSNEWYTPSKYIEAAREVMGSIDLDPASCALANETVKATRYFTKDDDGLSQVWNGNVWLNPPYCRDNQYRSNIGLFTRKLVQEYKAGNVEQAVLLSTCRTDTSWFHLLWEYPICFTDHKVGFCTPEAGKVLQVNSHPRGTIFVYLGPNGAKFIEVFSQFGTVARRIAPTT